MLRDFEQTAPPSLREGTPPSLREGTPPSLREGTPPNLGLIFTHIFWSTGCEARILP